MTDEEGNTIPITGAPRGAPAPTAQDESLHESADPRCSVTRIQAPASMVPSPPRMPTLIDWVEDYSARLRARRAQVGRVGLVGIPTGFELLDQATGGWQGLTVIAGATQTGKTSLLGQSCMAALAADDRLVVAYFLLDAMCEDELVDQQICNRAQIDYSRYVRGDLDADDQARVRNAEAWLKAHVWPRMRIFKPFCENGLTAENIFEITKRLRSSCGTGRAMIVIDMLDDIEIPHVIDRRWSKAANRTAQRIAANPDPWRLEQLARLSDFTEQVCPGGWPILAVAKLRKSQSGGARASEPTIEDLLGSVDQGYKIKRAFFLLPGKNVTDDVVATTLVSEKCRHARSIRLSLHFHHQQFRFEESGSPSGSAKRARKVKLTPDTLIDPLAGK